MQIVERILSAVGWTSNAMRDGRLVSHRQIVGEAILAALDAKDQATTLSAQGRPGPSEEWEAKAREALQPFAAMVETWTQGYHDSPDDEIVRSTGTLGRDYSYITVRDLRRARDVLAATPSPVQGRPSDLAAHALHLAGRLRDPKNLYDGFIREDTAQTLERLAAVPVEGRGPLHPQLEQCRLQQESREKHFLDTCENPPEPTEYLKEQFRRFGSGAATGPAPQGASEALEQIEVVCADNEADSCDHKMALRFVRSVARVALGLDREGEENK